MFWTVLRHRCLIALQGSHSEKFLQGLVTQDIRRLKQPGQCLPALFLDKQGKVQYEALILKPPPSLISADFLIDHSGSCTRPLLRMLNNYLCRSQLDIKEISKEISILQVFSQSSDKNLQLTSMQTQHNSNYLAVADPRSTEALGCRIYSPTTPSISKTFNLVGNITPVFQPQEKFQQHRLIKGIVENLDTIPIQGQAKNFTFNEVPQALNLDWFGYLTTNKGCYIGQETIVRLLQASVYRKRLVIFRLSQKLDYYPEYIYLRRASHEIQFRIIVSQGLYLGAVINYRKLLQSLFSCSLINTTQDFSLSSQKSYKEFLEVLMNLDITVSVNNTFRRIPVSVVSSDSITSLRLI